MAGMSQDIRRVERWTSSASRDGEPVSCRPAIYKGIEENNGETYCLFVSYNGSTFVINEHG